MRSYSRACCQSSCHLAIFNNRLQKKEKVLSSSEFLNFNYIKLYVMPQRCALGCPYISGKPYHRFPHPVRNPDRFKEWVCIVGGKLDSEDEIELYRKKLVCDIHFMDKDKNRNNRLNCLAVPLLHLDGKADEVDSAEKEVRSNMLSEAEKGLGLSDHETSTEVAPVSETILDYPSPISKESFTGVLDITSAKISPVLKSFRIEPPASRQTETAMCPDWINNADNLKEHNYCARDKTDITKAGESKYHQPTPPLIVNQLQNARKKVRQLQSEIHRLRKRNKIVKTRLINAKKNSKHNCLQKITQNMTAAAKIFTHIQFTQTQKKNAGRRFTLEGQQLSLSIYNSSPQCYDLLSKLFTLPSTKTLKKTLRRQFDIQPGLNNGLDEGPIQPGTF